MRLFVSVLVWTSTAGLAHAHGVSTGHLHPHGEVVTVTGILLIFAASIAAAAAIRWFGGRA